MCVCVYTYIIEYYSAVKKNENLPFATILMGLKSIMLSELNQIRNTDTLCYHLYV